MLIGEYEHSIDTKGRLIMPAKLKDDIGEKFVITKGLDGCLFVYSQKEWQNFEEKLMLIFIFFSSEYILVSLLISPLTHVVF